MEKKKTIQFARPDPRQLTLFCPMNPLQAYEKYRINMEGRDSIEQYLLDNIPPGYHIEAVEYDPFSKAYNIICKPGSPKSI